MGIDDGSPSGGGPPGKLAQAYHTGFRGDGRWIGFGVLPLAATASRDERNGDRQGDVVVALTDAGTAFVALHAQRMNINKTQR
jgi:hypothetical protein